MISTKSTLEAELMRRIITPSQFVADSSAFVDVQLPRSSGKTSFSFIGAGVTQNEDAPTNLIEAHGFCVGGAGLKPGMINNSHLHYTAEVFVCLSGQWKVSIGLDSAQVVAIGPGDIFSVPTWVFRSFENVGTDEGFMYTLLGGDDPGGILWAPHVLKNARETGFVLDEMEKVARLQDLPAGSKTLLPLSFEDASQVETFSDEEIQARIVRFQNRNWQSNALLSSVISGNDLSVAPIIGFGFNQHRRPQTAVSYPHGFSANWLRLGSGSSTGLHQLQVPAVVLVMNASVDIEFGQGETVQSTVPPGSVVSLPAGQWRNIKNREATPAEVVVAVQGDGRAAVRWDPLVEHAARQEGFAIDAGGCIAALELVNRTFG